MVGLGTDDAENMDLLDAGIEERDDVVCKGGGGKVFKPTDERVCGGGGRVFMGESFDAEEADRAFKGVPTQVKHPNLPFSANAQWLPLRAQYASPPKIHSRPEHVPLNGGALEVCDRAEPESDVLDELPAEAVDDRLAEDCDEPPLEACEEVELPQITGSGTH